MPFHLSLVAAVYHRHRSSCPLTTPSATRTACTNRAGLIQSPISKDLTTNRPKYTTVSLISSSNLSWKLFKCNFIVLDLKGKSSNAGSSASGGGNHLNHYGISGGGVLLNNVKSTNKDSLLATNGPVPPVDDCARTSTNLPSFRPTLV